MENREGTELNIINAPPEKTAAAEILSAGLRSLFYIILFFALITNAVFGIFPGAAVAFYGFTGNTAMALNYAEMQAGRGNRPESLYECVTLSASLFNAAGVGGGAEAERLFTHASALLNHGGAEGFFIRENESALARTEPALFSAFNDTRAYVAGSLMRAAIALNRQQAVNGLLTDYTTGAYFYGASGYKQNFIYGDFVPHFIFGAYFNGILDAAGFTGINKDGAAVYSLFPAEKLSALYVGGVFTPLFNTFFSMAEEADSALSGVTGGAAPVGAALINALNWAVFSEKLSLNLTYITAVIAAETGGAAEEAGYGGCLGLYQTAAARYAALINIYKTAQT